MLVLTPDLPPKVGGIERLIHEVVARFAAVEALVLAPAHSRAGEFDAAASYGVKRLGIPPRAPHRLEMAALNAYGIREATRFSPHAVLSAHVVTGPAARLLRSWKRIPYVQYVYGEELSGRPRLSRAVLNKADAVVVLSRSSGLAAIRAGARPDRLRLVPPGTYPPSGAIGRDDRPTVVTVARMDEPEKGHDVMLRAMPFIRGRFSHARWIVIGEGALRGEYQALAEKQGLSEMVTFLGEVDDVTRNYWLARAHVFALPSRGPSGTGEGYGLAYLEAAAHGLPVVAADRGGALDAIVPDVTGLLVDPGDPGRVADAVIRLLSDSELADALGRAGKERASKLSWNASAQAVEKLLEEVAGSVSP